MKKIILSLIAIFAIIGMTGCKTKETEKHGDKIESFSYNYGSYNNGYYEYNISIENEKIIYTAKGLNGVDLDIEKEIDSSYLEKLEKIIENNNINKWNNFEKRDDSVLDGYGFSLNIKYKNGYEIKAKGYMKYPKDYEEKHNQLVNFFEELSKDV